MTTTIDTTPSVDGNGDDARQARRAAKRQAKRDKILTDRWFGAIFMSDTARMTGIITRPDQGVLSVGVSGINWLELPKDAHGGQGSGDATVALAVDGAGVDDVLRLLPGEARTLASMLLRAAKKAELHR